MAGAERAGVPLTQGGQAAGSTEPFPDTAGWYQNLAPGCLTRETGHGDFPRGERHGATIDQRPGRRRNPDPAGRFGDRNRAGDHHRRGPPPFAGFLRYDHRP
ncbi:hypothetical protein GCM10023107_77840 [Actinoplanes octamycinicus]|nr:hypothetical protein Aoc01nite_62480 [Actinoplanes octamycinicus]